MRGVASNSIAGMTERARALSRAIFTRGCLAGIVVLGVHGTAFARAVAPPADRGDLAAAYLRFERAVAAAPKDPATRRAVNEGFDALTGDFFAGRFDRALDRLAELEGDLSKEAPDAPRRSERRFLAAHRIEFSPRIARADDVRSIEVRAIELEGANRDAGPRPAVEFVLRQGERTMRATPVADAPGLEGESGGTKASFSIDPPFAPGDVDVVLRFPALGDVQVGRISLFEQDPRALGAEILARIERLADGGTADPSTLASLRARHELIFGRFDRTKSADGLAHPTLVARALADELAIAEAGGRPYARAGDVWRVLRVLGTELPVRQFVPEGEGPFPLVVALHGAGGDENLFFDGYGGGRLLEVARARGIAVVCPPTIPFGVSPNVLPKFLEELGRDVPFDPSRVGLVGHSLGAATASRLAVLRPESINGAVCIAGFSDLPRKVDAPPRMVYLAALDPLFPLEATRAAVDGAKARGGDVDLVVCPDEGHTLVVGEVIDQAIDWLLARSPRSTAKTAPTQSAPTTPATNTGVPASRE
jgi:predicted esterase